MFEIEVVSFLRFVAEDEVGFEALVSSNLAVDGHV
jgi:hypothetical protein